MSSWARKLSKRNGRAQRKGWAHGTKSQPSAKHALQYFPLWERTREAAWATEESDDES